MKCIRPPVLVILFSSLQTHHPSPQSACLMFHTCPPPPHPRRPRPCRYLGLLEGRNPYALAHFANHPGKGMTPNTVVASFAVRLGHGQGQGPELRAYLPNMMFSPEGASHQRLLEEEVRREGAAGRGCCLPALAHLACTC